MFYLQSLKLHSFINLFFFYQEKNKQNHDKTSLLAFPILSLFIILEVIFIRLQVFLGLLLVFWLFLIYSLLQLMKDFAFWFLQIYIFCIIFFLFILATKSRNVEVLQTNWVIMNVCFVKTVSTLLSLLMTNMSASPPGVPAPSHSWQAFTCFQ